MLRKVGQPPEVLLASAADRLQNACNPLHQGRLARSVGADDRGQNTALGSATQVVNSSMALIAEREVFEFQANLFHRVLGD
ncbi:hypothetical protein CO676_28785 [Sinorhizobium sp. BJ1]|nr:hypothetical protein CO676_28785 [Sinorhizobium sp. BJ1]